MNEGDWRPLSVREGTEDGAKHGVLHKGLPKWFRGSLKGWLREYKKQAPDNADLDAVVLFAERTLRIDLGSSWTGAVVSAEYGSDDEILDFIDFLLWYAGKYFSETSTDGDGNVRTAGEYLADYLEILLSDASSGWMVQVHSGTTGLFQRVPRELVASAERVLTSKDRSSEFLEDAWNDIFGRNQDPSDGYAQAVKAVEAIAQPIVSPNDTKATLGKMINSMRDKPSAWTVSLEHPSPEEQVLLIAGMMELLWKGQHDRHGKADENSPPSVTPEEAEAAVHLAVTLVQWFRNGIITRV